MSVEVAMTDKTLGQQLDDKLSELVTRDDLRATKDAIIAAVNTAIEGLRVDLNKAGVPVRTASRSEINKH